MIFTFQLGFGTVLATVASGIDWVDEIAGIWVDESANNWTES